jgi:hypothetical protein
VCVRGQDEKEGDQTALNELLTGPSSKPTSPRLQTKATVTFQAGLTLRLLGGGGRSPLPPLSLSSLVRLYGWHMETVSIYPEAPGCCCTLCSGERKPCNPAGPFPRPHAKQPAVCREHLGLLHQCGGVVAICANRSSWAGCVLG